MRREWNFWMRACAAALHAPSALRPRGFQGGFARAHGEVLAAQARPSASCTATHDSVVPLHLLTVVGCTSGGFADVVRVHSCPGGLTLSVTSTLG